MDRIRQCISLAAGGLIGAAGAFTSLGFEQPGTQPSPSRPDQPGTQPYNPNRPDQPGTQPTNPNRPDQPGTQPYNPNRPDQPGNRNPYRPGEQPGLTQRPGQSGGANKLTREQVDALIASWPTESKRAAETTMSAYGMPDGSTQHQLIWDNPGPWKQVIVTGVEVQHNFPMSHKDCVMGVIDMRIPADKVDDLAKFDGSIFAYRTPGMIAAMCDKEEMNFAALNLAHDIISGSKSVDEARQQLAKTAMAFQQGTKDPITQGFQFQVEHGNTGDPGQAVTPGQNPERDLLKPGERDQDKPGTRRPGG